jgi:integrase
VTPTRATGLAIACNENQPNGYRIYRPPFASGVVPRSTPLSRHNLVNISFKPLLRRAGLPDIRFHDLRHTCATLMLAVGTNPKVVQETLGHAIVSVTLDIYSHLLPNMQDEVTQRINELLS